MYDEITAGLFACWHEADDAGLWLTQAWLEGPDVASPVAQVEQVTWVGGKAPAVCGPAPVPYRAAA